MTDRPVQQTFLLAAYLVTIIAANVGDAVLTLQATSSHEAVEANPAMAAVLHVSPGTFLVVKLVVVCLAVGALWRLRDHRWVLPGSAAIAASFVAVVTYEVLWLVGA